MITKRKSVLQTVIKSAFVFTLSGQRYLVQKLIRRPVVLMMIQALQKR